MQERDVNDAALLFAGNEHPPECYMQQPKNFDETEYTKGDYGKGTTALLNRVEEKWSQYGSPSSQSYQTIRSGSHWSSLSHMGYGTFSQVQLSAEHQGSLHCLIS